ncbi:DUF4136 domain-containing protein [Xanthocytophaga agilis]|uniref:DUF4136 domain-containing protein n=1 Tax=Xanthocytophaga agilis TaxID=3048010 RepID=A0AAE3R9L1_9BACT|nr:DUF4136 domain-containing protein [Xanthocytophaga agilis]MDJ1506441.1 DUF4136 domain-containing protein [Xanthocytophaga agilis]
MKKLAYMPFLYLMVWICSIVCMSSCNSFQVLTDSDPGIDLYKYHTFAFADILSQDILSTDTDYPAKSRENPLYHSSLIDRNIHAHIATELIARGMEEVDSAADMIVSYHTYTERKRSSVNEYYPMMYGGWYWRFYPWGMYPYPYMVRRSYNYTEGTLIIDLIDGHTKLLVWRGSIGGAIDNPAQLQRQVEQAVHLIFSKYPIPVNYRSNKSERTIAAH